MDEISRHPLEFVPFNEYVVAFSRLNINDTMTLITRKLEHDQFMIDCNICVSLEFMPVMQRGRGR